MLHEDRYAFLAILNQIHDTSGVRLDILEKDYYVSLLLRELAEKSRKSFLRTSKAVPLFIKHRKVSDAFRKILI